MTTGDHRRGDAMPIGFSDSLPNFDQLTTSVPLGAVAAAIRALLKLGQRV